MDILVPRFRAKIWIVIIYEGLYVYRTVIYCSIIIWILTIDLLVRHRECILVSLVLLVEHLEVVNDINWAAVIIAGRTNLPTFVVEAIGCQCYFEHALVDGFDM